AAPLAEPEKRPGAFAKALDQAGFGEVPQVPGQPRLRLAQNLGEVGDGELGLGEQGQNAQPGGFAGGLEHRGEHRYRDVLRIVRSTLFLNWSLFRYDDV